MENALDLHDLPNNIDALKKHILMLTEKFKEEQAKKDSTINELQLKYDSLLEPV